MRRNARSRLLVDGRGRSGAVGNAFLHCNNNAGNPRRPSRDKTRRVHTSTTVRKRHRGSIWNLNETERKKKKKINNDCK